MFLFYLVIFISVTEWCETNIADAAILDLNLNAPMNRLIVAVVLGCSRVHAIAQDGELLDKSQEQLEMLIRTIVRRCEEFQKESANQLENEDSLTGIGSRE